MVATEQIELFEVQNADGTAVLPAAADSITIPSNACNILLHFYITGTAEIEFVTSHNKTDWHLILSDKSHTANDLVSLDNHGQHIQQYLGYRVKSGSNASVSEVKMYFGRRSK